MIGEGWNSGEIADDPDENCQQLLQELVLCVQRVMLRHGTCAKESEENLGEYISQLTCTSMIITYLQVIY